MIEKTCCFTGHRDLIDDTQIIKSNLKNEIIKLIKKDVIYFGAGGARGFDTLAAQTIIELKQTYPQIKLILILPCKNQTLKWSEKDISSYEYLKSKADKIVILSDKYYNGCMQARNRHMVNHSKYIICYKRKTSGGSAYTVNYANKKGLTIIEI